MADSSKSIAAPDTARTARTASTALFTVISALICVIIGLAVGFVLLFAINPAGAWDGMRTIIGNFMYFPKAVVQLKYCGITLAKTAPLIMCSLSVIYANKAGMFNIGAAGQYVIGACAALFLALVCGMPWPICLIGGAVAGALAGAICGALKVLCNVNEVISGIMLNWIALYLTNMVLTMVKSPSSPYTQAIETVNPSAVLPTCGLDALFGTPFAGLGIFIALVAAIAVWARFKFTRLGFELKAVGLSRRAAQCTGMRDKALVIAAMAIAGGLAGLGGTLLYLNGYEEWMCSQSSVPAMGFNGIAAAFLGGSNPIAAIFSSFFIQNITDGGVYLDTSMYSAESSSFIAGVIIYLCGFMMMIRDFLLRRRQRAFQDAADGGADAPLSDGVRGAHTDADSDDCAHAEEPAEDVPADDGPGGCVAEPASTERMVTTQAMITGKAGAC